jgi:hypothetical protein
VGKRRTKWIYLYVLQGNYGYGDGWQDLTGADKSLYGAWSEVRRDLKDYQINEGGTYRIIERRERRP